MRKFVILAGVMALAVGSANCAGSGDNAGGLLGPTAAAPAAVADLGAMTEARGSGGGKPGGGGTTPTGGGSLTLVPVTDVLPTGTSFGDMVTFAVSTTATAYPYVTVKCVQNGSVVLNQSKGIFPTSLGQNFALGPTLLWRSGGADCTATLEDRDNYSKNGSITALASITFYAAG